MNDQFGFMQNPYFMLGANILAANKPGVGFGQALGSGVMGWQQQMLAAQLLKERAEDRKQKAELNRLNLKMKQQEFDRVTQTAKDQASILMQLDAAADKYGLAEKYPMLYPMARMSARQGDYKGMSDLVKGQKDDAYETYVRSLGLPPQIEGLALERPEFLESILEKDFGLDAMSDDAEDQRRRIAAAGTAQPLDAPVPAQQLLNMVDVRTNKPPSGWPTWGDIRGNPNIQLRSQTAQSEMRKTGKAIAVLDSMENLLFGNEEKEGILSGVKGLGGRAEKALEATYHLVTQDDPRYATYKGLSVGTLAPIVKSLGEAGALAKDDIKRAQELLAKIWPIPDSEVAAKEIMGELRFILTSGEELMEKGEKAEVVFHKLYKGGKAKSAEDIKQSAEDIKREKAKKLNIIPIPR